MAKTKTVFYCTSCGNETPKWQGRCAACGAWNTIEEHIEKPTPIAKGRSAGVGMSRKAQRLHEVDTDTEIRFFTGMGELDRVLGGGAVAGSLVLGILTLALQNCRHAFWVRHRQMLSLGWNAAGVLLFIISQQPYAAALLFLFLVIKALMAEKRP